MKGIIKPIESRLKSTNNSIKTLAITSGFRYGLRYLKNLQKVFIVNKNF
jgi:hypothetical protein